MKHGDLGEESHQDSVLLLEQLDDALLVQGPLVSDPDPTLAHVESKG